MTGAPPISQSEEVRHQPGFGTDIVIPANAPNDVIRHWVAGDPFPRLIIDTANFQIRVGDGSVEPALDLGGNVGASAGSEITIAATGPRLVIDPAGAAVIDATMDQNTVVTALPTPTGVFETKLILRGPFTPIFGPEFRFTNMARPSTALQTDTEYDIETHDRSASLRVISYPFEAVAPDAPAFVTAVSTGATTAHVGWLAPARNGGSAITGYKVTVRKHSDQSLVGIVHTIAAGTLFFDITGLTVATAYDVEVYAQNLIGDSGKQYASVTPSGAATAPGALLNLLAVPGVNKITITYSDPLSDGGSAITGFSSTIVAAGGGLTTPTLVQSMSTTTRVPVVAGTPVQWTAWRVSASGDVAQSNALTTAPTAGNTLIALIAHGSNGQTLASVPPGWASLPTARGMDTTGPVDGSAGADTICEIYYKVSDGSEVGALTWTYVGNDTVYKVQVLEVPGLGSLLGGSGTLTSGMWVHQVAFASPPASSHSCGASPTLDPTKNYFALALFNGTNNDSFTFDGPSGYTEHAPAAQTQHVATRLIPAGTTGTTSTTAAGGAQNVASCMLVWEVLPAGVKLTAAHAATAAGSKEIVTLHHTTAGRTTTGPAGWVQLFSIETTDTHCHLEAWRRNTPGGETSADWIISGADLAAKLTYTEWAGVGAADPTVFLFPAPAIATKTYDLGLSSSIPDKSLMVIAATLDTNQAVTFPGGWTPDFETGTDMAHVGHLVKAGTGTTHPILSWTANNSNGIGAMLAFDPAPAGYSLTTPVGAGVHTIVFSGPGPGDTLVAGLSHAITTHAINAIGPGPDTVITATPLSAIIPGAGGVAAVRAAMGTSAQSITDVTATTNSWNVQAAPTNTPINWRWASHTGTDTGSATDSAGFAFTLAGSNFAGAPVLVQRIGQYSGGQYSLTQIDQGLADAHIDAYGVMLQQITVAQGVPQWIRPLSEADGTWQAWKIDPANVPFFTKQIRRIISRVKAKCPTIKVTLTFDFGWGGAARLLNHAHDIWDAVMADLGGKYFGGLIDCVDIDAYSDGTPKVDTNTNLDLNGVPYNVNGHTWLYNEQQMYLARCIAWGVQCGNSEWGVGNRGPSVPAANGGIFYNADEYGLDWCTFWASLPGTGGGPIPIPGSLGHIELFDGSVYQGVLPDGRGVIHVPDSKPPSTIPDGILVAGALKTFLA